MMGRESCGFPGIMQLLWVLVGRVFLSVYPTHVKLVNKMPA